MQIGANQSYLLGLFNTPGTQIAAVIKAKAEKAA